MVMIVAVIMVVIVAVTMTMVVVMIMAVIMPHLQAAFAGAERIAQAAIFDV